MLHVKESVKKSYVQGKEREWTFSVCVGRPQTRFERLAWCLYVDES